MQGIWFQYLYILQCTIGKNNSKICQFCRNLNFRPKNPDLNLKISGKFTFCTVFENHQKRSHLTFSSMSCHFPPIFVLFKVICLVTLFATSLKFFKNSPKWTIFVIFNELLSTQNINVARFARNVECDFLWFSNTVILIQINGRQKSSPLVAYKYQNYKS